MFADIKEIC